MIKVQCDRCKREIEPKADIGYMSWCFKEGGVDGDLGENILEGKNFCEQCMDRIMCIICNYDDEELAEKAKNNEKPQKPAKIVIEQQRKAGRKKTNQNTIDAILELKGMGFKIKEIAEEVQMNEKQVSNIIYRYGK